jgi:3,5-epimerase/4-reductase
MKCIKRAGILYVLFFIFLDAHSAIFLVFGGERGWIGQKMVTILKDLGHDVHLPTSRLEDRQAIQQEIEAIKPDYIINSAGIIGKPTVDWCESHKQETIRANVLGILNLVDIAYQCNIHITNIATGCIYQYDENHPLGSGLGFTEKERPNFTGSFYSRTKVLAEDLIMNYPNVLHLRVRMPIASDLNPKGFIGKIINYKKLINIPNSMSILDDLLPLIPVMIERQLTGIYNLVNPGTISHNQVIELYKEYVDPNHHYENFTIEEQNKILEVPRSNCELSAEKLLKEFPQVPHIKESIVAVFREIAKQYKK